MDVLRALSPEIQLKELTAALHHHSRMKSPRIHPRDHASYPHGREGSKPVPVPGEGDPDGGDSPSVEAGWVDPPADLVADVAVVAAVEGRAPAGHAYEAKWKDPSMH